MPGESVRHRFFGGTVVLDVKNRRLLPERPLHVESGDFAVPIVEHLAKRVSDPRSYWMPSCRLLIRQRSEFELHRTLEVLKTLWLYRRVAKQQHGRVGRRVGQEFKPWRCPFTQYLGDSLFELRPKLSADNIGARRLGCLHPLGSLVAARRVREGGSR